MATLYKLTDAEGWTRRGEDNACLWGEGVTHSGTGEGDLCGPGYVHAYTHPLLAVLLNPLHADFRNPILWEAEGEVAKSDNGLKVGCVSLTTTRQIPLPEASTEQRVKFAILCALKVHRSPEFSAWAQGWLTGSDRSAGAAWEARAAARARARAEARAEARAWAAWAAAEAARAAAEAAEAGAWVAEAAARAAAAAAWVAEAAARAAEVVDFDLIAIAEEAMEDWT